jgi:hypothetical protein
MLARGYMIDILPLSYEKMGVEMGVRGEWKAGEAFCGF